MKRRYWLGLMIVLLICTSCTQRKATVQTQNLTWFSSTMSGEMYGNGGAFRLENQRITFQDAEQNVSFYICNEAGDNHPKSSCTAYVEALKDYVFLENGMLYHVTDCDSEQFGDLFLMSSEVDGTNRKRLEQWHDMQEVTYVLYSNHTLWILYCNQYDENMELLPKSEAGVVEYHLDTGEMNRTLLKEAWSARVNHVQVTKDGFFYLVSYYDVDMGMEQLLAMQEQGNLMDAPYRCELHLIDAEGKDYIIEPEVDYYYVLGQMDGDIVYNKQDGLYRYSVRDHSYERIGENANIVQTEMNQLFLYRYVGDGRYEYRVWNEEKGRLEVVGEYDNIIPIVVFVDYSYYYDFDTDDGNAVLTVLPTDQIWKRI